MPASPYWQAIEDLICRDLARCIRITQEYRPNESIRAAIYCNFYADEQYVCFPDLFMATAPVPSETQFCQTENCIGQMFEGDGDEDNKEIAECVTQAARAAVGKNGKAAVYRRFYRCFRYACRRAIRDLQREETVSPDFRTGCHLLGKLCWHG